MSNNLFFHNGQGIFEDRQVMFNGEKKVWMSLPILTS